jgi:hypothetical protein
MHQTRPVQEGWVTVAELSELLLRVVLSVFLVPGESSAEMVGVLEGALDSFVRLAGAGASAGTATRTGGRASTGAGANTGARAATSTRARAGGTTRTATSARIATSNSPPQAATSSGTQAPMDAP